MKFVPVWSYDNYVPAHVAMGRLQEDGIDCWLKDENTVTIDPILTNAVGGIKLMVREEQAKEAWEILNNLQIAHKATFECPYCGSNNIQLVTTPRKASNWLMSVATFLLGSFALGAEQVYHCFNCTREFKEPRKAGEV